MKKIRFQCCMSLFDRSDDTVCAVLSRIHNLEIFARYSCLQPHIIRHINRVTIEIK